MRREAIAVRRLAIPEAAAMLELHPAEVRALVEDGRLDAVCIRGRWLISAESVQRLEAARSDAGEAAEADAPDAELRSLEARVTELERRLVLVESAYLAAARDRGSGPEL